jgi:hypothetical protein
VRKVQLYVGPVLLGGAPFPSPPRSAGGLAGLRSSFER